MAVINTRALDRELKRGSAELLILSLLDASAITADTNLKRPQGYDAAGFRFLVGPLGKKETNPIQMLWPYNGYMHGSVSHFAGSMLSLQFGRPRLLARATQLR